MDKSERGTHDFMNNVESFSQLPFIRPAPSAPLKEKGIRLFGKEFGGGDAATTITATAEEESESVETNWCEDSTKQEKNENNNGGDCGRRFECHYCCRNFPTSQALGGHQNAHKRERQHAKRAQLQSAMVHTSVSSFSADHAHMYGALMNYRHLSAGSPPTWNNNYHNTTRYYGNQYGSFSHPHQPPINGSPLALWRIPTTPHTTTTTFNNRDRLMHHLPLFSGDEMMKPLYGVHGGGGGGGSSSQSSRYIYETKPSVQDHVSLDLHL